jgi:hypothetical protein
MANWIVDEPFAKESVMNVQCEGVWRLFIVLALCLGSVSAQNPSKDTSKPTILASATVPDNPAPNGALSVKDMEQFVIGSQDVIAVDVWKEPEVSHQVAVHSDGNISFTPAPPGQRFPVSCYRG